MASITEKLLFGRGKLLLLRTRESIMKREERNKNRPPTFVQKAYHLAKSSARHVRNDMKELDKDQLQVRLDICNKCEEWRNGNICTHPECGCNLLRKALWASESCPIGNWPAL